jgi:mRNA interferase RelE/StbE
VSSFPPRNLPKQCASDGAVSEGSGEDAYELRTTSTVRRALSETLPEAVAAAAYEFITGPLLRDPFRIGKRLLPPMDDRFSARRGTYRVIYRVDDKASVVTVVDVAHRRDVYRT